MDSLKIRKPDDMHVHLRQDEMLEAVLPFTTSQCARALVMPNTLPPVLNSQDLNQYREAILSRLSDRFEPLMTFKVTPAATREQVKELKAAGVVAGKLYPEGVTTNSEDGVSDFEALFPVYEQMEEEGIVLCIHGEVPDVFSLDRERAFLLTLKTLASRFPSLNIVLEHVTTKDAVECVLSLPENVACTITLHHLYLTLDDVIGGKLNPHVFCKPIAKLPADRKALVDAAVSGNPKFFFGSDSAPHAVADKECACGAAGVFTAPVLLPALCQLFEDNGALDRLEAFVSEYGANFYGLPLNEGNITLVKKPWKVPEVLSGVKPFLGGQELAWKLEQ